MYQSLVHLEETMKILRRYVQKYELKQILDRQLYRKFMMTDMSYCIKIFMQNTGVLAIIIFLEKINFVTEEIQYILLIINFIFLIVQIIRWWIFFNGCENYLVEYEVLKIFKKAYEGNISKNISSFNDQYQYVQIVIDEKSYSISLNEDHYKKVRLEKQIILFRSYETEGGKLIEYYELGRRY